MLHHQTHSTILLLTTRPSEQNLTPGAASVTAAGIAMSLRSLYHAFVNSSRVSEQLIIALSIELSDLQPLSSEEQAQWYQNLQEMQLQER